MKTLINHTLNNQLSTKEFMIVTAFAFGISALQYLV